jgi:hypothetical protein
MYADDSAYLYFFFGGSHDCRPNSDTSAKKAAIPLTADQIVGMIHFYRKKYFGVGKGNIQ